MPSSTRCQSLARLPALLTGELALLRSLPPPAFPAGQLPCGPELCLPPRNGGGLAGPPRHCWRRPPGGVWHRSPSRGHQSHHPGAAPDRLPARPPGLAAAYPTLAQGKTVWPAPVPGVPAPGSPAYAHRGPTQPDAVPFSAGPLPGLHQLAGPPTGGRPHCRPAWHEPGRWPLCASLRHPRPRERPAVGGSQGEPAQGAAARL